MSADLTLKESIVENEVLGDIITQLKLKLGIKPDQEEGNSTAAQKKFEDINFLSQLKLFHVFVINEKQTALVVDKDNRIYELKRQNVTKSGPKTKKGKNENFVELNKILNEEIVDICCGESHSLALTKNGDRKSIYAWGDNYYRQLGNNSNKVSEHPTIVNIPVKEPDSVKKVCCGYYHNLALSENGLLYAWGCNEDKQCCGKKESKINEPIQILEKIPKLVDISCGAYHSLALDKSGNVYSWGKNDYGQLGIGHNVTSKSTYKVSTQSIYKIVSGYSHNLLLTNDGQIYGFGSNQFKQISEANQTYYCKPIVLFEKKETHFQDIAASLSIPVSLASVKNISGIDTKCFAWGSGVKETENQHSMQEWFVKYKNSTYRPVNFQHKNVTLKDNSFRDERIGACFWSAANNILENYEFEKPQIEDETKQQKETNQKEETKQQEEIKPKEEKDFEIKNLFINLMRVSDQIPPDSEKKRVFAKMNIYHTLNGNMWKKYKFKPYRYANEFDKHTPLGSGGFGTVHSARFIVEKNNPGGGSSTATKYHEVVAIKQVAIDQYDVIKSLREIELVKNLNIDFVVCVKRFWLDYNELFDDKGEFTLASKPDKDNKLHHTLIRLNIESELCLTSLQEVLDVIESKNETTDIFLLPIGYYIVSELVLEILSAVDYLHRHNLTHRDLCPKNILIKDFKDYDGAQRFVKIADFGLAVFQYKDIQTYSTDNIKGKNNYIPPEVLIKANRKNQETQSTLRTTKRKIDNKDELKNMISHTWDLFSIGYILKQMFFINTIQSDAVYEKKSASIHEKLSNKYRNLFKETNLLRSETADERPKCNELLKEEKRRNYLLNKQECLELCEDKDLSKYKQEYNEELKLDNFVDFFLYKKLN